MKTNIHSDQARDTNGNKGEQSEERGFILIAVIVILAILTIVGAVSIMKSTVEVKVSAGSVLSEQAVAAANAGLAHNYAYWSWDVRATAETADGTAAKDDVVAAANAGTATVGIYDETLTGTAMLTDAVIQAPGASVRVYNVGANGLTLVTNNAWATVNTPQVAVWATRFNKQTDPGYPYTSFPSTGTGTGCSDCNIAVYALGRAGPVGQDAHSLLREIQMTTKQELKGASALTNAPKYDDFQHACAGDTSSDGTPDAGGATVPAAWKTDAAYENTVIEATQAPYNRNLTDAKSNPSGTAIVSNTDLGGGGKGFRNGDASATGASFEYTPMLAYSGHGPAGAPNNVQVDLADVTLDTTVNYDNLPADELPHSLVKAPTMTTDYVDYFKDAKSQLFKLDVYRWAAEEFTCQDTTKADGTNGNGRYCSNAEALRLATGNLPAMTGHVPVITTDAPVSGRLTMAEFEYNANYGIPMFGMVRVMTPTTAGDPPTTLVCASDHSKNVVSYQVSGKVSSLTTGHKRALPDTKKGKPGDFNLILNRYDGSATLLDGDGVLDDTARVLVYGSLLFDYFTDTNGNGVFDPAAGERLLTPLESAESYMKIEFPILINPSMPRGTLGAFPTAAGGTIATGSNVNPVNLASPTAGYFPASEGLLVPTGSGNYKDGLAGTMRLMSNGQTYSAGVNSPVIANDPGPNAADGVNGAPNSITMPADGLISVSKAIKGAASTTMNAKAASLFTTHKTELEYYYNLMVANAKQSDVASWPIAPFPATLTANFAIGQEDCGNPVGSPKVCVAASYNQGDALHLLFPSGYMHGWKVALAALDLTAADWNGIFTNLDTDLAKQHDATNYKDYGDAARPKGSPFNVAVDGTGDVPATCGTGTTQCTWAEWITDVKDSESDFFYVDAGSGGYGLLTEKWQDIPAEMYVGGLLDMHAHANINGVVYTPGPLEWEPGNSKYGFNDHHLAYINGAIITGFGAYVKNKIINGRYVLVYSNDAVDNINTSNAIPELVRFARQSL